jgi:hypothetical protein
MQPAVDVTFNESPVLRLGPDASEKGIKVVAGFDEPRLRSGWAWNVQKLAGGAAVVEAPVGKGKLYLYAPEVLYRGQSHGTFQLFFNALYLSASEPSESAASYNH